MFCVGKEKIIDERLFGGGKKKSFEHFLEALGRWEIKERNVALYLEKTQCSSQGPTYININYGNMTLFFERQVGWEFGSAVCV